MTGGATTIADRVVAAIAGRAADETAYAGGVQRSVLGVHVGDRRTRADVTVDGHVVTARLAMSVAYPAPVRQVARQARDHVRERVEALTGLTVSQVDIDVEALVGPANASSDASGSGRRVE